MSQRIICLLIGYAFGLIQTGFLYGKARGIDIRARGSGNSGATNTLRTLGKKAGFITMGGDIGKCLIAILVTWAIFYGKHANLFPLLKIWTAAGVILGHDFPFYMDFKGGKGIAATGGMIIAFGDKRLIAIGLIVFIGLFVLTHYVSLASIVLSLSFLFGMIAFGLRDDFGMTQARFHEMVVITAILTALALFTHRENIVRLVKGVERKTYITKKNRVD